MSDDWNKDNFSIGEVSEIFAIPAKMLRYWDQIGLIKPFNKDEINGYRYYSTSQFYLLNFIRYLRELGVPYDVIKTNLHETGISSLSQLITGQISATEDRIRELTRVRDTFRTHISEIDEALRSSDLDAVEIRTMPPRDLIVSTRRISSRMEFEIGIRSLEKIIYGRPTILLSQVALIMDRESLLRGEYGTFKASCIASGQYQAGEEYRQTLPEGKYAVLRFWGSLKTSAPYYKRLTQAVTERGYEITGDLIRKCLAPGTLEGSHEHMSEISVPVRKRTSVSL